MLSRKLTLCAGAGLLFALAKPIVTSWTATLSPVGGSSVSGTAKFRLVKTRGVCLAFEADFINAYADDTTR